MVKTLITLEEARKIAERKRVVPAKLAQGKGYITFVGRDMLSPGRFTEVSWAELEKTLTERKLALFESGGYLLIRGRPK